MPLWPCRAASARLKSCLKCGPWRQLGYHGKPLGLLNVAGYYDGLLGFLQTSVKSGFMGNWQMELLQTETTPAALLRNLVLATGPDQPATPLRAVI